MSSSNETAMRPATNLPTTKLPTAMQPTAKQANTIKAIGGSLESVSIDAKSLIQGRFTLFQKVPLEIRLMIWRTTFPAGRHVPLDTNFSSVPPLPISLSVNRESRAETLRYYVVLYKSDLHKDKHITQIRDRPFCFNPARDSVWLPIKFLPTAPTYDTDFFNIWMEYIDRKLPGGTRAIKILEIREMDGASWWSAPDRWSAKLKYEPASGKKGLEWFTGLDGLAFTEHDDAYTPKIVGLCQLYGSTETYVNEDFDDVGDWFASPDRVPGTKVPVVVGTDWGKLTSAVEVQEMICGADRCM